MAEVITLQGENLIAEKQGNHEILNIDTFILSYDPDLDPAEPIERKSGLPDSDQIVYQSEVTQSGYVNPNQVVYSLFMDNTVGPFQFNRMDLVSSNDGNTNIAIATFPAQNKVADDPENGIRGQSMTRNFMTVYDGAQAVTGITVEAAVWQIDFMARLHASDQLVLDSNRDIYGRACFWKDGFKVVNQDGLFQAMAGTAYVEGIRIYKDLAADLEPGTLPKDIWLDISLQGNLNGVSAIIEPKYSTSEKEDYTDSNGVEHFLEKIAEVSSSGVVTDTRSVTDIAEHLLIYLEQPQWSNILGKPDNYPPESHTHPWNEVTEKPSDYPPSSHDHSWKEINNKPDEATRWPTFDEITGKPSTYPPSSHNHPWGEVTGKPSSFPPSSHNHEWEDIKNPKGVAFTGVIWMFAGTESQIADGWKLCNGEGTTSNGIAVPDLRDRMIVCAGGDYDFGDTGGSERATTDSKGSHSHGVTINSGGNHSHTITVSSHTLTESQMPKHRHTFDKNICEYGGRASGNINWTLDNRSNKLGITEAGGSQSHNHTASSNSTGSHGHSASTESTGNHTHTVSTLSPYYALAFIIKL